MDGRRRSSYFVPIPATRKMGGQLAFEIEWTADRLQENLTINRIRERIDLWRQGGHQGVTAPPGVSLNTGPTLSESARCSSARSSLWRPPSTSRTLALTICFSLQDNGIVARSRHHPGGGASRGQHRFPECNRAGGHGLRPGSFGLFTKGMADNYPEEIGTAVLTYLSA